MSRQDITTVKGITTAGLSGPGAEGRPQLVLLSGTEPGRVITFEGSCLIGRSSECNVALDDPGLSRRHALVEHVRRNTYRVRDLGSTNGTFVDGEVIGEREVGAGATIQLGRNTVLRLLIQDPAERELEEAVKLELISRLATGLSHDFNNLVFAITSNVGFLQGLPTETPLGHAEVRDCLLDLAASSDRAIALVRQLVALTRSTPTHHVRVPFSELLARAAELAQHNLPRTVTLSSRVQPGLEVMGDEASLEQLVLAPCLNARDAMPEGGTLTLNAEVVTRDTPDGPRRSVVVRIEDSGTGMASDISARAFEPLFSTKPGARGLGLSMARKIARDHGGDVQLASSTGTGTVVTIELPAFDAASTRQARATLSGEPPTAISKARVLIADDEAAVGRALSRVLTRAGYDVVLTHDGRDALDKYLEQPDAYDVVLLDVDMPRMSGPECFARLRLVNPDVRVIMMSGLWHREPSLAGELARARAFLHKPVEPKALERTLALVLSTGTANSEPLD